MSQRLAPCAVELQDVLERFNTLSATALRACDECDTDALETALDARDLLWQRAALLARQLVEARRAGSTRSDRDAIDVALRAARVAADRAQRGNAELAERAERARATVADHLDRARHDEAARVAYAAVAQRNESPRLDFKR